jgi:patatin-like phospholipase/acyl hydrolase
MKKIRILTIDGGGIRGIIPAVILSHIEQELQRKTNNPTARLADYFDMIAGTSTGGILTAFYLMPADNDSKRSKYQAQEAIELYKKHGKDIFKKRISLTGAKYEEKGLEQILKDKFSNFKLSETRKKCVITAYDITEREAVFFTTPEAKESNSRDYFMRDVARATSAAPTYFAPTQITPLAGTPALCLVDGGMFANDPSLSAIVEAHKTEFPNLSNPDFTSMYVVSVGTGKVEKRYEYNTVRKWRLLRWIAPVIDILMSSSAEVTSYQVQKIFNTIGCANCYVRIEPNLGKASADMDNVSNNNIAHLEQAGENYVNTHKKKLEDIVDALIANA